ncbi:Mth938-like domain-containing protein [Natronohydrobacter thiooxidans]|uniref:Mth938-like domain-containing protein n=1 Tax=Natronohydrobacter thiooxidans TaxID=87172 RepID=UPI0008FF7377|nr:Mth938-like domain-containing protein [Natronohydrobacter thiooxidans]
MRISEVDFGAKQPVDGYGPDFFRLGGVAHPAPLLVAPGIVQGWGGYADHETLLALAGQVDVLLIGTGGQIAHIPTELREVLEAAGLGVEAMDSPAACRTYNVLLSEARRVALAVLPVG